MTAPNLLAAYIGFTDFNGAENLREANSLEVIESC